MSANTNPLYPLTPASSVGILNTTNTAFDGTGTIVNLFTAGSFGAMLDWITFTAGGTSIAGLITIFVDISGTYTIIGTLPITAVTPSTTVAPWSGLWVPSRPLVLAAGVGVGAAITVGGQTIYALALAGSY